MSGVDWYLAFIIGLVGFLAVLTVWACVSLARQPKYQPPAEVEAWREEFWL